MDGDEKNVKRFEKRTKTPEQALSALMHLCSKAERSSGDALRLMRRWGIESEKNRLGILKTLIDQRFIDDSRYARAYVRDKSNLSGWGEYKIRAGLKAKGVAVDIIDDALNDELDRKKSNEKLRAILERKMHALRSATIYEKRVKLIRFGLSRGFELDSVVNTVDSMLKEQ